MREAVDSGDGRTRGAFGNCVGDAIDRAAGFPETVPLPPGEALSEPPERSNQGATPRVPPPPPEPALSPRRTSEAAPPLLLPPKLAEQPPADVSRIEQLQRRVDDLERRVAELERALTEANKPKP